MLSGGEITSPAENVGSDIKVLGRLLEIVTENVIPCVVVTNTQGSHKDHQMNVN